MKMAQNKHLFELLKEDQEPFFLKDYIADRRCQLLTKTPSRPYSPKTHDYFQAKKIKRSPKPTTTLISSSSSSSESSKLQKSMPQKILPKNACFSSSRDTTKSPLFEFPLSPISIKKSPTNATNNPILLHIPAKTAALLLEAALRIQKQASNKSKAKPQKFGLFGSLLKRLTSHRSNKKKEIGHGISPSEVREKSRGFDGFSRPSSSVVWSESNEEKSVDLETSSSGASSSSSRNSCCNSQSEESVGFVTKLVMMRAHDEEKTSGHDDEDFAVCDDEVNEFSYDQSPFRFVLQRSRSSSSSSSGRRTPDFSSPARSPARRRTKQEGKENPVAESSKGFQAEDELEEEEKEQFSPVSVLDPPFEDDYDGRDDEDEDHEDDNDVDHDDDEEEDGFNLESSYAIVQRTKQQLLQKLRRFEKLAELDPIELEKRMLEVEDEGDEQIEEECEEYESYKASDREANDLDCFIREVLSKSSFHHAHRAPRHMKRLISDLIVEEQSGVDNREEEEIVTGVVKRFESWKEVQSNTIDMMVEQDFRKELEAWKDNKEQVGETAIEVEIAIFGLLVEELAQELVCLSGN